MCLICIGLDNGSMKEYEARLALIEMRSEIGPHAEEIERKLRLKSATTPIPMTGWVPFVPEYDLAPLPVLPQDCTADSIAEKIKAYLPSYLATPIGPVDSHSVLGGLIDAIAKVSEERYWQLLKIANKFD